MSQLVLNPQQDMAIRQGISWYRDEKYARPFYLTGYAGTGKTSIVQQLLHEIGAMKPGLCAPTGKAARVLTHKSKMLASTIHSLLYRPISDQISQLRTTLGHMVEEQIFRKKGTRAAVSEDFDGYVGEDQPYAYISDENLEIQIQQIQNDISELEKGELSFSKSDFAALRARYDLLVVDEASMVSKDIAADLIATGVPLLLVYDPFQLPPVKSATPWPKRVDVELTQIMRQGEGSGVAFAAEGVRKGRGLVANDDVRIVKKKVFTLDDYHKLNQYDMVLAGTNMTRRNLNRGMRRALGRPEHPVVGDKVIALGNTRKVRNGEIFHILDIEEINKNVADMVIQDQMGEKHEIQSWLPLFQNDGDTQGVPFNVTPLTFGNCITVHKSQGSEAERVLLIDDWKGTDYDRWLYTGITRASKECVVIRGRD